MDQVQIAWVAGLLEGEASFNINKPRRPTRVDGRVPQRRINICCTSTDRDVIDKLKLITGVGGIYSRVNNGLGKKLQYTWQVQNRRDAEPLLKAIRPHMGQRRGERIDEILAYFDANPVLPQSVRSSSSCYPGCTCSRHRRRASNLL